MFAFNGLAFLALTGIQQFIAVFFPLKLRMWVTTGKTRLTLGAVYLIDFSLQGSMYLAQNYLWHQKAVLIFGYVDTVIVLLLILAMIFMYFAMFLKFFIRACFKKNAPVIEGSQTHGEFHDKKTVCMLFVITLGSEFTMVAHFLNTLSKIFGLEVEYNLLFLGLIFMMVQWILAPCVYISMNFKTWKPIFQRKQAPNVQNNTTP